jgi:hypothetical protein
MKAPALIVLLIALLMTSCTHDRRNGTYLIYSGTPSNFFSNPFYNHRKSQETKDLLVGNEFKLQFNDSLVVVEGYTKKRLILIEDLQYSKYNSANRKYNGFYRTNDFQTSFQLFTQEDSPEIKINIRKDQDEAKDKLRIKKSFKFIEFSVKLKKI